MMAGRVIRITDVRVTTHRLATLVRSVEAFSRAISQIRRHRRSLFRAATYGNRTMAKLLEKYAETGELEERKATTD